MNEDVAFIYDQIDKHSAWFAKCLPMIASENVISPLARELLLSDFGDRYAEGLPHERYYQGNLYTDEVEIRVNELAKKVFRCRHADPRLISGTTANMAVYFALHGRHPTYSCRNVRSDKIFVRFEMRAIPSQE